MNVVLAPSLAKRLREYADFYVETCGSREEVAELAPFMLEAFLESDADYKKAKQKDGTRKKRASTLRGTSGLADHCDTKV
jgi:hypothetical protein